MRIPRYWVREQRELCGMQCRLRGFSDESMTAAQAMLEEHARVMQEFFSAPVTPESLERMRGSVAALAGAGQGEYAADLLEPVCRELDGRNIITRNRYGALVLNSTEICFVDVDDPPAGFMDSLLGLVGLGAGPEQLMLRALHKLHADYPELGMRLYETAAGWRVVLTGQRLAPGNALQRALFTRLHADELYTRLCAAQQCWRARLTPKPARLGMAQKYPGQFSSAAATPQAEAWVQDYLQRCAGRAVCRLVDVLGPQQESAALSLHDELTGAASRCALA